MRKCCPQGGKCGGRENQVNNGVTVPTGREGWREKRKTVLMGPGDECMGQSSTPLTMVDEENGGPMVWEGKETQSWQHQRGKWKARRPFISKGCS